MSERDELLPWSHVTVTSQSDEERITITLPHVPSETREDYIQRFQTIADYAATLLQYKSGVESFPGILDEVLYVDERISSHQSQEKPTSERDTHFQNYGKLLYEDLYWMFNNLFIEEADMLSREQEAEQTRQHIQSYLSERGYDLVYHALYYNGVDAWYRPGKDYHPTVFYERKVTEHTNEIPDLAEWPE